MGTNIDHSKRQATCNTPLFVGLAVGALMSCTTILYHFAVPDDLQHTTDLDGKIEEKGVWGIPDSDFNWCEPNYQMHPMVAEPLNSVTSLLYVLASLLGISFHYSILYDRYIVLMFVTALVGIGSTLFHSTLRYEMQLLDELPMHYLVAATSYYMLERGLTKKHGRWLPISFFFSEVAITTILLLTPRTEQIHDITRGFMIITFSIGFVYILIATAVINNEISELSGNDSWLFLISFMLWIISIVCWIADILLCTQLQNLPFGLPYPQLHAFGWHLGTAFALYYTSVLVILRHKLGLGRNANIVWYGCFPAVKIITKNEKIKIG